MKRERERERQKEREREREGERERERERGQDSTGGGNRSEIVPKRFLVKLLLSSRFFAVKTTNQQSNKDDMNFVNN